MRPHRREQRSLIGFQHSAARLTVASLFVPLALLPLGCKKSSAPSANPPAEPRPTANGGTSESRGAPASRVDPAAEGAGFFVDVTRKRGLDFTSDCGPHRTYFMPESVGSGVALFDYDGDGDLDLYCISASWPPDAPTPPPQSPRNRLFRQKPDHTFEDVTDTAGVGNAGYGMGAAVGDIDNDGDLDLYVTNYGPNVLYRNDGDGTFTNVTAAAGVGDSGWSVSAAFVDMDADGFLDLYVVNYLDYDPKLPCTDAAGRREYCGPERFPGALDRLYRNRGDGAFEDISEASGIHEGGGRRGLGVICADLTRDGRADIYVANDNQANQLWVNQGGGRFIDDALLMGVAYNDAGQTEAGMGVVCEDLDRDQRLDLFITHLRNEKDTFYRNLGDGFFEDASAAMNVVDSSMRFTSFGVAAFDLELDGDMDLAIVSGHVFRGPVEPRAKALEPFWRPYAQPGRLLTYEAQSHRMEDADSKAGDFSRAVQVGRGLAWGDLDHDGDVDLVTSAGCGEVRIYENRALKKGHWLVVEPFDSTLNRIAVGSLVEVRGEGGPWTRRADPASSYLSSNSPTAHFGLGGAAEAEGIGVTWPGGLTEWFPGCEADRVIRLIKGKGAPTLEAAPKKE